MLIVGLETLTQANQRIIVDLAMRHTLPAIYASKEFIGGLLTYGVNVQVVAVSRRWQRRAYDGNPAGLS
jgi:hypothetical protein